MSPVETGIGPLVHLPVEARPNRDKQNFSWREIVWQISNDQSVAIRIAKKVKLDGPAAAQITEAFDVTECFFNYVIAGGDPFNQQFGYALKRFALKTLHVSIELRNPKGLQHPSILHLLRSLP